MLPPLKLPTLARPFSRTKLMAALLGLLQILQELGLLDLSPETLHKASVAIAAAGLWFLRSAIDRARDEDPGPRDDDLEPRERLPYEKPGIRRGVASQLFGRGGYFDRPKSRRRLLAGGLLTAALLSVGCAPLLDMYQAAASAVTDGPSGVLEDVEAVVTSQPERLEGSQLAGRAFTARVDGQEIPVVCMAELEARCSRFQTHDRIDIDKAFLRTGAVEIAGVLYRTYLEIARCRRARS